MEQTWPAESIVLCIDRDGTISEIGQPPGSITFGHLRQLRARGYLLATASNDSVDRQVEQWTAHGVPPDIEASKQTIGNIKQYMRDAKFVLIGDSQEDADVAREAGVEYLGPETALARFLD